MMPHISKKIDSPIGYFETKNNLAVRIEANKRFSNFSLEDWINRDLPFKAGDIILDIGCGTGNLFPSYSGKLGDRGVIVGIDQSNDLLSEAGKRDVCTFKILEQWDMNNRLTFIDDTFHYVISTFAIYYVKNVNAIIGEIKRVLKASGEVFLIGPTDDNAKELYEFNKKIFNFGVDEKIIKRTNRIKTEFYPLMKDVFRKVSIEKIPSRLVFPDKEEFMKYYTATLLFEESAKKSGFKPDIEKLFSIDTHDLTISKEMIVLRCRNE